MTHPQAFLPELGLVALLQPPDRLPGCSAYCLPCLPAALQIVLLVQGWPLHVHSFRDLTCWPALCPCASVWALLPDPQLPACWADPLGYACWGLLRQERLHLQPVDGQLLVGLTAVSGSQLLALAERLVLRYLYQTGIIR